MAGTTSGTQRKNTGRVIQDTTEILRDIPSSVAKGTAKGMADFGQSMFDQLMGDYVDPRSEKDPRAEQAQQNKKEQQRPAIRSQEFVSIFDRQKQDELRTIRQLTEQIHKELQSLKQANSALISEFADVEKVTMNSGNEKPGIYHIRFLEVILGIIQNIRAKMGESRTWMQAMSSKKAKRGSAFSSRSKKQGTQYSMSEEHKITRNTQ